jgi:hypothetical protein
VECGVERESGEVERESGEVERRECGVDGCAE